MPIATLTVDINAKLATIQGDLGRVAGYAEAAAKRLESAFSGVGGVIKAAFSGFAATLATGFLTDVVQKAVDAQDALSDLSKSTALSVETLSGLGFAATTTGSDLDSIAKSINRLQVNIGNAPEKYRQLGIDARDGYEAFKQLADIFQAIEDPETRAAVAAEALGKAWAGAAPALSEGAAGFEALVAKGKDLSGVTTESAARAAELNAKLDILKARATGAATEFVNSLVPSLDRTAARMEALAAQGKGLQAVFVGLIGLAKLPFDLALGEVDLSVKGQIADLELKLQSLETKARQAASQTGGLLNEWVYGKKGEFDQQIAVTRNQLEALKKYGDKIGGGTRPGSDPERKPPSEAAIGRFLGRSGGGRSGGRSEKAIDDGQRLLEQLRDRIRSTAELTEAEKLESEIADGKYKTASAANLEIARGYAQTLDAIKANKVAAEEEAALLKKRADDYQRIFDATRTPVEALNIEIERLLELLNDGTLGEGAAALELFGRAAAKAGEAFQSIKKPLSEIDQFAVEAARNIQDAFADFLFDPFDNGVKGMVEGFGVAIRRMIANAVAADLGRRMFGNLGAGEGVGGWVGGALEWLSGVLPQFDVGTDYVPRDMIAKIHKGERIVPAAQNNRYGGHSIVVNVVNSGGGSVAEAKRSGGTIAREVLSVLDMARRYQ